MTIGGVVDLSAPVELVHHNLKVDVIFSTPDPYKILFYPEHLPAYAQRVRQIVSAFKSLA